MGSKVREKVFPIPYEERKPFVRVLAAIVLVLLSSFPLAGNARETDVPWCLDSIYVAGDTVYAFRVARSFTQEDISSLMDDVLRPWYREGYYWARVSLDEVRRQHDHIALRVRLQKGPRVSVSRLAYSGLTRTREDLLARYVTIDSGALLTDDLLARLEEKALRLRFVAFHPPVRVLPQAGYTAAEVELRFSEKKQFQFSGGGGYVPDESTGLIWHLQFVFTNLFGKGKQAEISTERREKGRRLLELRYRQPLFLIGNDEVAFAASSRNYQDQFYEFRLEGTYETRLEQGLSLGGKTEWKSVEPSDTTLSYSRFLGGVFVRRTFGNAHRASSGFLQVTSSVSYSFRRYRESQAVSESIPQSYNETRLHLGIVGEQPLFRGLSAFVKIRYWGLETSEPLPPLAERFFVGGPGTVRGFRNEQFTALRVLSGSFEPRWYFSGGYLFLFYDGAYLSNRLSDAEGRVVTAESYHNGYGVGISVRSSLRSVNVSFGWNPAVPFDQPRLAVELSADL